VDVSCLKRRYNGTSMGMKRILRRCLYSPVYIDRHVDVGERALKGYTSVDSNFFPVSECDLLFSLEPCQIRFHNAYKLVAWRPTWDVIWYLSSVLNNHELMAEVAVRYLC